MEYAIWKFCLLFESFTLTTRTTFTFFNFKESNIYRHLVIYIFCANILLIQYLLSTCCITFLFVVSNYSDMFRSQPSAIFRELTCSSTRAAYVGEIYTYLLTPWSRVLLEKLTGFAANQEIPRILWNPKVHHRTHRRPPPVRILSQLQIYTAVSKYN